MIHSTNWKTISATCILDMRPSAYVSCNAWPKKAAFSAIRPKAKRGLRKRMGKRARGHFWDCHRHTPSLDSKGLKMSSKVLLARHLISNRREQRLQAESVPPCVSWFNRSWELLLLCLTRPVSTSGKRTTTTTMVFFLGGCTCTEIAALRWAGCQTQGEFSHLLKRLCVCCLSQIPVRPKVPDRHNR